MKMVTVTWIRGAVKVKAYLFKRVGPSDAKEERQVGP
jgi:hypothetical protein